MPRAAEFSRRAPLIAFALLTAAGAQAYEQRPGARPFVSPAGKVFRGSGGEDLVETWFRQADADHDGAIGFEEFRADFVRTFAEFDRDGDGEIEPEEVTHYETVVLPEIVLRGGVVNRVQASQRQGRGMRRGSYARTSGAARFGLISLSHPIMDADEDFNRGVTRAEFERAAVRRFNLLDTARDGRLSLADVVAHRPGG
jgi:EF hand domain-containing protein